MNRKTAKSSGAEWVAQMPAGASGAKRAATSQNTSQNFTARGYAREETAAFMDGAAEYGLHGGRMTGVSMDDYERETYRRSVSYGRARGQM